MCNKFEFVKKQIIISISLLILSVSVSSAPLSGTNNTSQKKRTHAYIPVTPTYWLKNHVGIGPQRKPSTPPEERTEEAINAEFYFWQVFQNGLYDLIPDLSNALTAAYLIDPNDAKIAALIGSVYTWQLSERMRMPEIPATITNNSVLARKYFEETVKMDPQNAHYIGFLGSMMMAEADIHNDNKLFRKGYLVLKKSIRLYPEFNLVTGGLAITGGIVENIIGPDSKLFKEALEWQWRTMELCFGTRIDRSNPDVTPYMERIANKRVCGNSEIAPHKFEGFFLNMGDMLVKSGDWETAQKIYANARLAADYLNWHLVSLLEDRITEAEANVILFNTDPAANGKFVKPMMSQSGHSCTGCHQH